MPFRITLRGWLIAASIAAAAGVAAGCETRASAPVESPPGWRAQVDRINQEAVPLWLDCEHVRTVDQTLIALAKLPPSSAQKRLLANLHKRRAEVAARYSEQWRAAKPDVQPHLPPNVNATLPDCDGKSAPNDQIEHRFSDGFSRRYGD